MTRPGDFLPAEGILVSAIGYDTGASKRAILRAPTAGDTGMDKVCRLWREDGGGELTARARHWGRLWEHNWWVVDCTAADTAGVWRLDVPSVDGTTMRSDPLTVASNRLYDTTWRATSIGQLQSRRSHYGGWFDCGATGREANAHALQLVGLADLLAHWPKNADPVDRNAVLWELRYGLAYLASLQLPDGRICHHAETEMPCADPIKAPDTAQSAWAFALAARVAGETFPAESRDWQQRAARALGALERSDGFSVLPFDPIIFGHDRDQPAAPATQQTATLMTAAAAEVELWRSGQADRLLRIEALLDRVAQRQISEQDAEGGLYGHSRTWGDSGTSEKACVHWGGSYGEAQFVPHWIVPFADMVRLQPDHPAAVRWQRVVTDFVHGYLLPGCRANPFLLLPNGYYRHPDSSGLQWFSAQWHGRNGTFGFGAALALELAAFLEEPALVDVARAQLQWIAGLNVGLPATRADQEVGRVFGTSMIFGVGHRYVGGWAGTHGRIANGFASGREFVVLPPSAGDRPDFPIHSKWEEMPTIQPVGLPPLRGSEEYIVHSGGWLSGISRLRGLAPITRGMS